MSSPTTLVDGWLARMRTPRLIGLDGHMGRQNVYVSGYPVSGNSWIAYLIAYVLNSKYWDVDETEWSPQRLPLKKYLIGENAHQGSARYDSVLKTHAPPSMLLPRDDDIVIYIVRNVNDVANSCFHRINKVYPDNRSWKRRNLWRATSRLLPLRVRYRALTRYFARIWAQQVREVLDADHVPIVRYEDCMENDFVMLEKIVKFIDTDAWDAEVARAALDIFSLQNMKAAARQSSAVGAEGTDRVGGADDWKNYFNASDTAFFDREYAHLREEIATKASFVPQSATNSP